VPEALPCDVADTLLLEVHPGAEGTLPGAGQDDHPDVVVGLQTIERLHQVGDQSSAQRVHALGAVERQPRDPVLDPGPEAVLGLPLADSGRSVEAAIVVHAGGLYMCYEQCASPGGRVGRGRRRIRTEPQEPPGVHHR
jgi:hypothetical protein